MGISWTRSIRLLYHMSSETSKSVSSLMLETLIFHFYWAKTPWKETGLVSILRMSALWCLKRKFHWDAHCQDITTSLSLNLYQTKVSSNTSKNKSEKVKIATRLHRQFSHPSSKKLCDLIKNAEIRAPEFIKIKHVLPNSCEVCIRYKKTEPRPIVGFTVGSYFNKNIAMDIKKINGNQVLELIDHATKYNVGVRIPSKESSDIINTIFKYWIIYFETPGSILTDNGREFNNQPFRDMAQNLNIIVRTTPAESPWSNGLNEWHNGLLGEMVKKTLEDTL